MSWIEENGVILSFADSDDVENQDQRLLQFNHGLTDEYVDQQLERATRRVLNRLKGTNWWVTNWSKRNPGTEVRDASDVPPVDPQLIVARISDFTDLCVYTALAEYILPSVADFGADDNAERAKQSFYEQKAQEMFDEIVTAGDWYDWNTDGVVDNSESSIGKTNLKRIR